MALTPIYRVRALGHDKWPGVGAVRRRSIWAALGLRRPLVDATPAECALLRSAAVEAARAVEIGVFEGVGAAILREAMDDRGELILIDPYPPGRLFGLNMARIAAHRGVNRVPGATVRWIRRTSSEAASCWPAAPIDFLRIDGEHTLEGVRRDWSQWARWVVPGGHVALHHDVAPAARADEFASADEIVPWILEGFGEWSLVSRVDATALLRRSSRRGAKEAAPGQAAGPMKEDD